MFIRLDTGLQAEGTNFQHLLQIQGIKSWHWLPSFDQKVHGPQLTARWNSDEWCHACFHVKRCECSSDASCRI